MKEKCLLRNEDGAVLVIALIMMGLLILLGVSASTTTEIEMQIAGNERSHGIAFYAAEAAGAYVAGTPDLYGADNITPEEFISFPDDEDASAKYALGSASFNGDVEYLGSSAPPRGSGYGAGKFKAHNYKMTCNGYGPRNSASEVEAGFYRIGF
jgi:hypothetical protein